MARGKDIVIGRRGDSITGKLQHDQIKIKSAFGAISIPTGKIAWIRFKNLPRVPQDEIWLHSGDRLLGKLQHRHLDFKVEGGMKLKISPSDVTMILLNQSLSLRCRPLLG
jgi:hypothetical protein